MSVLLIRIATARKLASGEQPQTASFYMQQSWQQNWINLIPVST